MQQEINACMKDLKLIFNSHDITGFNKMNIFKNVYSNLKSEYSIDLYERKNKNNTALYNLFATTEELQIFKDLMISNLKRNGYELGVIADNKNYYSNKEEFI